MILSKKQYTSWDNILIPYKSSERSTVLYSLIRLLEYISTKRKASLLTTFISVTRIRRQRQYAELVLKSSRVKPYQSLVKMVPENRLWQNLCLVYMFRTEEPSVLVDLTAKKSLHGAYIKIVPLFSKITNTISQHWRKTLP